LGLLDCTGRCDEGNWLQEATAPAANKAMTFNLRKRRRIVIIGTLTFSATIERVIELFTFDNTERSVCRECSSPWPLGGVGPAFRANLVQEL
jgi:hypothetical protein